MSWMSVPKSLQFAPLPPQPRVHSCVLFRGCFPRRSGRMSPYQWLPYWISSVCFLCPLYAVDSDWSTHSIFLRVTSLTFSTFYLNLSNKFCTSPTFGAEEKRAGLATYPLLPFFAIGSSVVRTISTLKFSGSRPSTTAAHWVVLMASVG
ncbi:hypothetical protein K474DRAFT_443087 [Panus rudis PR-1116 ss-1]|nr:hypothetical protein K474DRAFT_443087 [Panus rudis PR-1116 ss-1]